MNNKLKLGVIGCGVRSDKYLKSFKKNYQKEYKLTAVMDPDDYNADNFIKEYGTDNTKKYYDLSIMLNENEFDGVILASPNRYHLEQAIMLLRKNINFLLEKPIVCSLEQVNILKDECKKSSSKILVGFVLRYTQFYRRIKEIIEQGLIGNVHTIVASELVGISNQCLYSRQWRQFDFEAGSFLLEKCCHDFDILNYLTDSIVQEVISFKGRDYFTADKSPAEKCVDCPVKYKCIHEESSLFDKNDIKARGLDGTCVFKDGDNADHQVANLRFKNGVLATFAYSWGQPRNDRTIQVLGSSGHIIGRHLSNELSVHYYEGKDIKMFNEKIVLDNDSGHGGGDDHIQKALYDMLCGNETEILAGIDEGIEGALTAFAAEKSCVSRAIENLDKLRKMYM